MLWIRILNINLKPDTPWHSDLLKNLTLDVSLYYGHSINVMHKITVCPS